jgi:polysaccharide pyruvyl transferase WcaK-like protein
MNYVIIGSSLYGNKGAASMLEASIQTISKEDKQAKFTLLSLFPDKDAEQNNYNNLKIISAKPIELALIINTLAILYKILVPFRKLFLRNSAIKSIVEADVFLDQGGITFVDGRSKYLLYNVASILPALVIGVPVVKCSQALGPFNSFLNKTLANYFLPKVKVIFSRGRQTTQYLNSLNLPNVSPAADYGFLLNVVADEKKKAQALYESITKSLKSNQSTVAVIPSEVVRKKFQKQNRDYEEFNVSLIDHLLSSGKNVILLPHSARQDSEARMNNDMLVCRDIAKRIDNDNFVYLNKELSAQQLRYIIGKSDAVVTSRFHAMVSSLETKTAPFIIGWSHKYQEVMEDFAISEGAAFDFSNTDNDILFRQFDHFMSNRSKIEKNISNNLNQVKESAYKQVSSIVDTAKD